MKKDLFSTQAADYARFRPRYPRALFEYLSSLCTSHERAWDCGTGSGQAAVALTPFFDRVVATDPSSAQLERAELHPKVEYRQVSAESSELKSHCVDLVTVAQAFHWFDQPRFFKEVRRVLRPGGVLALWTYPLSQVTPAVDRVVLKLYAEILGPYWEPERSLVESGYSGIEFPFVDIASPAFTMEEHWSLDQLRGYLGTWSALQAYQRQKGSNPLSLIDAELASAWGGAGIKGIRWPLAVKVGRW